MTVTWEEYQAKKQYYQKQKEEWMLAQRFVDKAISPTQVRVGAPGVASKMLQIYEEERAYKRSMSLLQKSESEYFSRYGNPEALRQEMMAGAEAHGEVQTAYKDPATGLIYSYAPGTQPKGYVPVAVSKQGVEYSPEWQETWRAQQSIEPEPEISPTESQVRQEQISAGKEAFRRYPGEVSRYKGAGFPEEQAMSLAEYSLGTYTTPGPELGEQAIRAAEVPGKIVSYFQPVTMGESKLDIFLKKFTYKLPESEVVGGSQAMAGITTGLVLTTQPGSLFLSEETLRGQIGITKGLFTQLYWEARERPAKFVALTAAGFGVAGAIRYGAMGASWLIGKTVSTGISIAPEATEFVSWGAGGILKYGLPAAFIGTTVARVSTQPTPELMGAETGKIIATVAPLTLGYYAGQALFPRLETWVRPGGEELPEIVFPPEYRAKLAKGEAPIPTAPVEKHLEMFTSKKYAPPGTTEPVEYHLTTGQPVGVSKLVGGGKQLTVYSTEELLGAGLDVNFREASGLFGSPYPSVHFARIPGKTYFYGSDLPSILSGRPGGLVIQPTKFKTAPIVTRGGMKTIGVASGEAGVPGIYIGKPEPQAISPPGSVFVYTGKRYHFWYRGYKIVLEEVIAKPTGIKLPPPTKAPITPTEISLSSYGIQPSYLFTPASIGISTYAISRTAPSYKSSSTLSYKSSYKPSYKPSYVPSYILPYKPYQPSYAPSYKPSYARGYTPSYTPPYYPTYYPPSKPPYKPPTTPGLWPIQYRLPVPKPAKYKRQYFYQPGIAALGLNIKMPKIPSGVETGLVLRPKLGR